MIQHIIIVFFYLLTAVFILFFAYEQSLEQNNYSLLLIVFACLFIIFCFRMLKNLSFEDKSTKHKDNYMIYNSILFVVMLLGCVIRLYFCNKNNVEPISDFRSLFNEIGAFTENNVTYSKSLGFVIPYGFFLQHFGNSVFLIQFTTIIVYMVSTFFAYKLCVNLFSSYFSGLLAAFFVSTYPPFVLYSQIVASEHIWFMYLIIALFLEEVLLRNLNRPITFIKVLTALFLGFFIQMASLTRGNSLVLLPISIFMIILLCQGKLKNTAIIVFILCLGFFIPKLYIKHLEHSSKIELTNNVPTSYVLAIGTNLETRGRYNSVSPNLIRKRVFAKYGKNAESDKYLPVALEFVYEKWKNDFVLERRLAWDKITLVTSERFHYWVFNWYTQKDENGNIITSASKQDREYCKSLTPFYQIIFSLSSLFCLFLLPVLSKSRQMIIYSIVVFLLSCLILQGVHEYQPRYSLIYFWGLSIIGSAIGKQKVSPFDNVSLLSNAYNRFSTIISGKRFASSRAVFSAFLNHFLLSKQHKA